MWTHISYVWCTSGRSRYFRYRIPWRLRLVASYRDLSKISALFWLHDIRSIDHAIAFIAHLTRRVTNFQCLKLAISSTRRTDSLDLSWLVIEGSSCIPGFNVTRDPPTLLHMLLLRIHLNTLSLLLSLKLVRACQTYLIFLVDFLNLA